jgi:hypothetical protein
MAHLISKPAIRPNFCLYEHYMDGGSKSCEKDNELSFYKNKDGSVGISIVLTEFKGEKQRMYETVGSVQVSPELVQQLIKFLGD